MKESERGHEKGKESGGKEGAGGGDGEGDGGKDQGKSAKIDNGKGFVFGKTPEGERSAKGGPNGSPGWKEYFHKMNEKDLTCDLDESEDDDNLETRRMEGRPGKLNFTADEYAAWCMPWMNSLIIKVLGASFPTYVIRDRINHRAYAFQEGPWMIEDHYLTIQRWRPNFNPHKADIQCNVAAWVRLPDVPFEFYNVESLRRIGNMIGKMIKVDRSTSIYDKGGFARICVEIDLKKPLLPSYVVFGEERQIVYKGLHQVCFKCGKYGHKKTTCPMELSQSDLSGNEHGIKKASNGGDGDNNMKKVGEQGPDKANVGDDGKNNLEKDSGGPKNLSGGDGVGKKESSSLEKEVRPAGRKDLVSGGEISDGSPFGKLKLLHRDFRGHLNVTDMNIDSTRFPGVTVEKRSAVSSKDINQDIAKSETRMNNNDNKQVLTKEKGPQKAEWV
ncbi:hypothetical protein K1719_001253 [Acacia pycnantha]|nr:hypothetical protein K1719_001253 [Acacia pycnantha]